MHRLFALAVASSWAIAWTADIPAPDSDSDLSAVALVRSLELEDPRANDLLLRLQILRTDANESVLTFDALHLKWAAGDSAVFEQDVVLPAVKELKTGAKIEMSVPARIPPGDGQYLLEVSLKLPAQVPAGVPGAAPIGLTAIPSKRVIRVKVGKRVAPFAINPNGPDTTAILDGSTSEPKCAGLVYQWRQKAGLSLELPPDKLAKPTIKMRFYEPGTYVFELRVGMNGNWSAPVNTFVLAEEQCVTQIAVRRNQSMLFVLTTAVLLLGGVFALILRRFVRVHLSTLLAMLMIAGGLLLLNARVTLALKPLISASAVETSEWCVAASPGWPRPMMSAPEAAGQTTGLVVLQQIDWLAVALDTAAFLATLGLSALILELCFGKRALKRFAKIRAD